MAEVQDNLYREGSFVNGGGLKIFTQAWVPEKPKALLVLYHGLGDHSTRYTQFARFLAANGFAVHTYDQQSHGMSEGSPEYVDHFNDLLEDAYKFATVVKKDYPTIPHVVVGHSMGGLLALQLVLQNPKLFDAAVVSAPSNKKPEFVSDFMFSVGKAAAFLFPWARPQPLDISTLCRDAEVVKAYQSDPLVWHSNIPLQLGSSILVSGTDAWKNAERFDIPYLLMHGSADKMTVPEGSQEIHAKSKSKDKSFIMFKDFYHELWQEPEKKEIFQIVVNWLNERITSDGSFKPIDTNYTAMGEADGNGGIRIIAAPKL